MAIIDQDTAANGAFSILRPGGRRSLVIDYTLPNATISGISLNLCACGEAVLFNRLNEVPHVGYPFVPVHIEKHPDISHVVANHFHISKQTANKHLKNLVAEGALLPAGQTRSRKYTLAALLEWRHVYTIRPDLEEDRVWARDIAPLLGNLPQNVMEIWHFCITEMFNNAADHSGGGHIVVNIGKTAANTQIMLDDNGVGIFRKDSSCDGPTR